MTRPPPDHPVRTVLRVLLLLDGLCVLVAGVLLVPLAVLLVTALLVDPRRNAFVVPALVVLSVICLTGVLAQFCRAWLDDPPRSLPREALLVAVCGLGGVPLGLVAAYMAPDSLDLPWLAEVWQDGSGALSEGKLILALLCASCGLHALCAVAVRAWQRSER